MSDKTEVLGDDFCYFHANQGKLAYAIVNNGQFDMPACLSCLAECMKAGYTVTKTLPLFDLLEKSMAKQLRDGEPCGHPGCLHHVTHPCEGCGRIAGRSQVQDTEAAS